jgi:hypothetical protein
MIAHSQRSVREARGLVTLTDDEARRAVEAGRKRHAASRVQRLHNAREDLPTGEWMLHDIMGALGEFAACKALGRTWEARINNFHNADFGERAQVRTSTYRNACLIVRPKDNDDHYFILVVGDAPPNKTFTVIGYIKGADAKRQRWRRNPRGIAPAYFVPQSDLLPL